VGHQRPAPALAARVRPQLRIEWGDLDLERVDHRDRDGDLRARGLRQRQALQPLPSVGGHQRSALRAAVVIEHRLDPLLPLGTLVGEGVTQPHTGAQIQQVRRRDPGLWQPSDHQQLAQVPRVRAVGFGALLAAAPRAGLRRLGQMRPGTDRLQLLDHEPPARRRLQRHLEPPATEAAQELPHALATCRHHARPADLAGGRVDPLGRDLRPVLIDAHHDRARTVRVCAFEHPRRLRGRRFPPDALRTVGHGRYLLFEMAGHAGGIRVRLDLCRSTRRTGHLQPRRASPTRPPGHRPAHAIF
jgi:hypothetical protein